MSTPRYADGELRIDYEPNVVVTGDGPTENCSSGPERPLVVPVIERGTAKASFEWATPGSQVTYEITLERYGQLGTGAPPTMLASARALLEVPGVEPGSSVLLAGLLRAQPTGRSRASTVRRHR